MRDGSITRQPGTEATRESIPQSDGRAGERRGRRGGYALIPEAFHGRPLIQRNSISNLDLIRRRVATVGQQLDQGMANEAAETNRPAENRGPLRLAQNLYRHFSGSSINGGRDCIWEGCRGYESFIIRGPVKKRIVTVSITVAEMRQLADAMGCRTQSDLGERLGITQSRVSQILSGSHPVKRGPLMTLVRALQAKHSQRLSNNEMHAKSGSSVERRRTAEASLGRRR